VYVGNLPFDAVEQDVTAFFAEAGFETVKRVHLPTDPEGRRRGFGFVTLEDEPAAKRAAESLDGASFRGRQLGVNLARRGGGPPSAGGPRSAGPAAGPRGGSSWAGASSAGADGSSAPWRPRAPRAYDAPPPPEPGGAGPPKDDEAWRAKKRPPVKDKKQKRARTLGTERTAVPKQRRRNEEFRSSRAKDYIDDWEDD
jgi:RNA recognition motif-containing protein